MSGTNPEKVGPLEKKVILTALTVSAVHLMLIAYAAIHWGLTVPTCVTNVKPFESGSITKIGDKRYEIHVVARMWNFDPSEIQLPTGSTADIYLTSKDVTHGYHIDGTNVNLMAVPFVVNNARVKFDHPGVYHVTCHEYCGSGHQAMNAAITVSDNADASAGGALLANAQAAAPATLGDESLPGRKLLDTKGCVACHSLDDKPGVGPTFKGIYGRKEDFADSSSGIVDDAYIKESIQTPMKKVVKGFAPAMPQLPVSEEEIAQIIAYLKTLK